MRHHSCMCRAFGKSITKTKNNPKNVKLTHATKFVVSNTSLPNVKQCFNSIQRLIMCLICSQCQQQPLNNTCGFYVAHNLMIAMGQINLDDPKVQQIYLLVNHMELVNSTFSTTTIEMHNVSFSHLLYLLLENQCCLCHQELI